MKPVNREEQINARGRSSGPLGPLCDRCGADACSLTMHGSRGHVWIEPGTWEAAIREDEQRALRTTLDAAERSQAHEAWASNAMWERAARQAQEEVRLGRSLLPAERTGITAVLDERDAAVARAEKAETYLARWTVLGYHTSACRVWEPLGRCNCGLDERLAMGSSKADATGTEE